MGQWISVGLMVGCVGLARADNCYVFDRSIPDGAAHYADCKDQATEYQHQRERLEDRQQAEDSSAQNTMGSLVAVEAIQQAPVPVVVQGESIPTPNQLRRLAAELDKSGP